MSTLRTRLTQRLALPRLSAMTVYQGLIVLAVLAFSVYLANKPSVTLVYACVGLVGLYIVLRQPWLGPLLVIVVSLLVRFAIGTGTQTALHLAIVIIPCSLALWAAEHLYRQKFRLLPSRTTAPLMGLGLVSVVALIAGNLNWIATAQSAPLRTQLGALGIFLLSIAAFWITANQVRSLRQLQILVWVFLAIAGLYVVGRIGSVRPLADLIPSGAVGSVFWVMAVALASGQALFNSRLWPGWRLALAALALALIGVSLTGTAREWTSGWLPALLTLGVVVFLRWPRFGIVAGVLGLVGAAFAFPLLQGFLLSGNEYSLLTRQAAIEIVLRIAQVSPLIGIGPANYYYYTPLFPILGWYVSFNSHNQYADIIAQIGLVGLAFVLWFFLEAARTGYKLYRQRQPDFTGGYAAACLAAIVAILFAGMLGDWFLPFVYNIGITGFRASVLIWLFLGGLVVLDNLPPAPTEPEQA